VRRQCQRPDCSDVAAVAYSFDARRQLVVLDRMDQAMSASGVLCNRHATALVVPRGWWLDDRRILVPTLFATAAAAVETAPAPRPVASPRQTRAPRVVRVGLPFDADADAGEHVAGHVSDQVSDVEGVRALVPIDQPDSTVAAAGAHLDTATVGEPADSPSMPPPEAIAPAPVRRPAWMPSTESDLDEFGDVDVPSSPLLLRAFSGGSKRR
jgi:hypothetical protein